MGLSSGTVKVSGQTVSQSVAFTSSSASKGKTNQSTGLLGLPGYEGFVLIGVNVSIVVALLTVALLRSHNKPATKFSKIGDGKGQQDGIKDSKNIADGAASEPAAE